MRQNVIQFCLKSNRVRNSLGADCCVPHNKSFNASVDYYTKTQL